MVSLKIAVALAALNILCIDASPVKRDDKPVPVMLCKDAYWKSCPSKEVNLYFQNGGCAHLGDYAGELSSFHIKKAGYDCYWFTGDDCTGDFLNKNRSDNLQLNGDLEFNDALRSVKCKWRTHGTSSDIWGWRAEDSTGDPDPQLGISDE